MREFVADHLGETGQCSQRARNEAPAAFGGRRRRRRRRRRGREEAAPGVETRQELGGTRQCSGRFFSFIGDSAVCFSMVFTPFSDVRKL